MRDYIPDLTERHSPADTQAAAPACCCTGCGGEVYPGESLVWWDGKEPVCPDCFRERLQGLEVWRLASMLGLVYEEVR